ncbi:MmgE/PrpD family protein [Microbacterium sp. No. 7]|uniref:MmgE/PrpD family protein n=1 Tax=Microbacterium sp. No. 7 TaxID=1714373 RepID=UPI0006D26029|nr:MmgE/PrpD family protein [Microbacterium sp. No. 7]ALJ21624.1 2-methylcitrate dehydratase [Microbacterium sp. No. 7]
MAQPEQTGEHDEDATEAFPPVEEAIARLVVELTYERIPADALEGVRRLMEDQLALQVGCVPLPWNRAVLALTRASHAPGRSHVTMAGDETFSAADAAFVNATYGHSFEYDDAHEESFSHPGSCVVSAAIAIGEELGSTMEEVVTGLVAGYEVYTRIGILIGRDMLSRGFHPHAQLSNFGAAAVAAKMRGLDVAQTLDALSIAMSHASGTTEYTSGGGSVKRVHAGIGTRNGIRSAEMAAAGITGPPAFLTGSKGWASTFIQRRLDASDAGIFALDRPFEITKVCIKSYCCCFLNHAYILGAKQLQDRTDDIASVLLRIQPANDVVVGNRNAHAFAPTRLDHLQYSLPFQFSLALLGHGNGFSTHHRYFEGGLDIGPSSDVAQLAQRITIEPDAALDAANPGKFVADITVTHDDGARRHVFVGSAPGTADSPTSPEDLEEKFRDLTTASLGADGADALLAAILELDPAQPVAGFAALLQGPRG